MHELSLFTGAGGGIWGSKLLGWRTVGYVERDDYCQRVIRQRICDGIFDDAPIFDDVRTFSGQLYRGRVDCVTAGFPCQPFSGAGKQLGANDGRNLWPDTFRIIGEVQPRYALLENVPNLISSGYFAEVLKDLSSIGYNARWQIISAQEIGAPHIRKRLWILATNTNGEQLREQSGRLENFRKDTPLAYLPCSEKSLANSSSERCEALRPENKDERETRRDIRCRRGWAVEPDVGRVAHGVADRKHRLKALGNGQVPRVVETAWQRLTNRAEGYDGR